MHVPCLVYLARGTASSFQVCNDETCKSKTNNHLYDMRASVYYYMYVIYSIVVLILSIYYVI